MPKHFYIALDLLKVLQTKVENGISNGESQNFNQEYNPSAYLIFQNCLQDILIQIKDIISELTNFQVNRLEKKINIAQNYCMSSLQSLSELKKKTCFEIKETEFSNSPSNKKNKINGVNVVSLTSVDFPNEICSGFPSSNKIEETSHESEPEPEPDQEIDTILTWCYDEINNYNKIRSEVLPEIALLKKAESEQALKIGTLENFLKKTEENLQIQQKLNANLTDENTRIKKINSKIENQLIATSSELNECKVAFSSLTKYNQELLDIIAQKELTSKLSAEKEIKISKSLQEAHNEINVLKQNIKTTKSENFQNEEAYKLKLQELLNNNENLQKLLEANERKLNDFLDKKNNPESNLKQKIDLLEKILKATIMHTYEKVKEQYEYFENQANCLSDWYIDLCKQIKNLNDPAIGQNFQYLCNNYKDGVDSQDSNKKLTIQTHSPSPIKAEFSGTKNIVEQYKNYDIEILSIKKNIFFVVNNMMQKLETNIQKFSLALHDNQHFMKDLVIYLNKINTALIAEVTNKEFSALEIDFQSFRNSTQNLEKNLNTHNVGWDSQNTIGNYYYYKTDECTLPFERVNIIQLMRKIKGLKKKLRSEKILNESRLALANAEIVCYQNRLFEIKQEATTMLALSDKANPKNSLKPIAKKRNSSKTNNLSKYSDQYYINKKEYYKLESIIAEAQCLV